MRIYHTPNGRKDRAESIVHAGDRRHARFMAGAGLVIHDAQDTPEEYLDAFVEAIEQRARGYAEQLGSAVRVCCAYEGLELAVEPHSVRQPAGTPLAPHAARDALRGSRILGVDDDPDVLDLLMPKQGGLEVLTVLRSRSAPAALPVLVLTAQDDEVSTRAGFELGASDYLTKPFSIPQLAARVRACLSRRG